MIKFKHDFIVGHQTVWEGLPGTTAEARCKGDELATRMGTVVQWKALATNVIGAKWETKGYFIGLRRFKHKLDGGMLWEMSEDYSKMYCCMEYATTPSQAQKLVGLGLKPETADLRFDSYTPNNWIKIGGPTKPQHIPVWSLNMLMKLLSEWTYKWDLEPTDSPEGFRYMVTLWGEDVGFEIKQFIDNNPVAAFCKAIGFLLSGNFKRKEV